MAIDPVLVDPRYIKGSTETSSPAMDSIAATVQAASSPETAKDVSTVKQFLKAPMDAISLTLYGSGKPERRVVRAKLIHGKG